MSFSFLNQPRDEAAAESARAKGARTEKARSGRDEQWSSRCLEILHTLSLHNLEARVTVEWNPRMRSAAGRAFWPQGLIQLNPRLAKIAPTEVERTVLHELAHLIAYERNPHRAIKSHGPEWQKACADIGIPGEKATHQLELPTRSMTRKWQYECPACQKTFDRVRRFKGAVACYECCLKTRQGSYDERFRLIERRLDDQA